MIKRISCLLGLIMLLPFSPANAHHTDTHFEESSKYKIVYQCNRADSEYLSHILFSVGELLRKHGDDVEIVVACFGPGLNLLGRQPLRPIPKELQQRVTSLSNYGVRFHACRNTMDTLHWSQDDIFDFVRIVPVGVEDIMLLQMDGFSYFSW